MTIPTQPKAFVQALLKQLDPKEVAEISKALADAIERQAQQGTDDPTVQEEKA
jgi:hypothetical protein